MLVSLPLVLLVAAFAGLGLSRLLPVSPPQDTASPAGPDPLAALPASLRRMLTNPEPVMPARLTLTFTGRPADLCDQLNALGMTNSGWRGAPLMMGRYQCASELITLTTPSVDYGPSTLFFLLRGRQDDRIDYLRLKLVVDDPAHKPVGVDAVELVIGALSDRYGWAVPNVFWRAVAEFEPLELIDRGVRLSVAPEDPDLTGDPKADRRLNIVLDFSEPDLIRPADTFLKAPPFDPDWTVTVPPGPAAE
ncbi:hypothetical protein GCM10011316_11820 [Roseibium aquae]|uniref:Uncharacterized protein n=1 Tax=Roseibium aquae TaxID=1323746 RepID=A0A916WZG0_9HYPH|nr:DUF6030 family protein [Roseibium aquae]GGB41513.1 hypothetical protein GCM10011316_11820 [Roseibium aquae]